MSTADRWEQTDHTSDSELHDLREHNVNFSCRLVTSKNNASIPDLRLTHDLSGNLCSIGETASDLLAYEPEELLAQPMWTWISPESRQQFDSYLKRVADTGAAQGHFCVSTRKGERRTWQYTSRLFTDGPGSPAVQFDAHDVTDRRLSEQALRVSEQRYRTLFEKNVAGVLLTTLSGIIVDCNQACASMFGFPGAAQARGWNINRCYPEDLNRDSLVEELKSTGTFQDREFKLRRNDGTHIWVLLNAVLISNCSGEPLIQSTLIDISKRKKAEQALLLREEDYRTFVAQSSEGIFREELDKPVPIDLPEDELVQRILRDSGIWLSAATRLPACTATRAERNWLGSA